MAAGKCLVGNVGTAAAKTFSVVGPAFTHALLLERLTRMYGAGCDALVTERVLQDVSMHFRCRVVDRVVLPQRRDNQPMLIAALLGPVGAAEAAGAGQQQQQQQQQQPHAPAEGADNDEWLYVLEANARQDPSAAHNEAFNQLALKVRTNTVAAETLAVESTTVAPSPFRNPLTGLPVIDQLAALVAKASGPDVSSDLGPFFNAVVDGDRAS